MGRVAPERKIKGNQMSWFRTCVDYYEAAALYEELNRLSDAELARRGLDRANLARDVCATHDRSANRSRE